MKKKLYRSGYVLCSILLLCFSSMGLHAQTINLKVSNKPIIEVLKEISAQTEYKFVYSDTFTEKNYNVTYSCKNGNLKDVLNKLFAGRIRYKIQGKNIAVSPIRQIIKSFNFNEIKGIISDDKDLALPGVTVQNKTTEAYALTDNNGAYTLKAKTGDVLSIKCIGMKDIIYIVKNDMVCDFEMEVQQTSLDAVMVVAYGVVKQSSFTGSAATISKKIFDTRPVTNVSQALVGLTPGLEIGSTNGNPGSSPTIRIRGLGSFNASNNPLIILDGMPYDDDLSCINPNDIESITVLKDASSTALYGARAANGVLMITTKKGKQGDVRVTAKYSIGFTSRQTKDYETLGMNDYMQMYWESTRNNLLLGGETLEEANSKAGSSLMAGMGYNAYNVPIEELFDTSNGKINSNAKCRWADDLNWRDYVERTAIRHDAIVSISGAMKKYDYYTSIGYTDDNGYIVNSEHKRYSIQTKLNSQITKWLKLGAVVNTSVTKHKGSPNETWGDGSNPFRFVRYVGNIFPVHIHNPITGEIVTDESGNELWDFGYGYTTSDGVDCPTRDFVFGDNPAREVQSYHNGYDRNNINAKTYAEISFLKDFTFRTNVSLASNTYSSWGGMSVYKEMGNSGTSWKINSQKTIWNINQILSYKKAFGKHHFDAILGHESYDFQYRNQQTEMKGQIIEGDNYEYSNMQEIDGIPTSYINTYKLEGYFSRVNYDYDEKYFISGSFRRDGSSRFYKDNRWGNFWSLGTSWRLDNENFMDKYDWVSLLKLRASYGYIGNDNLESYYPWRATYYPYPNGSEPGYLQSSLGNKNLTWEKSKNFSCALEYLLFDGRLSGIVEYFDRRTSDLLFELKKPLSSGVSTQKINAGSTLNHGVEITLDIIPIRTDDLEVSFNFNTTLLKNKMLSLPMDPYINNIYRIEEGHSRYEFYMKQWEGVNPDDGNSLFLADIDNPDIVFHDGEIIERDGKQLTENLNHAKYDWCGNAIPKASGGIGVSVAYKNFSLSVKAYYQLGGKYYDSTYKDIMSIGTKSMSYRQLHEDIMDRWTTPGQETDVPRIYSAGSITVNNIASGSTRWLTTSNMLQFSNIYLSYKVPANILNKLDIKGLLIYASGENLGLLTARKGMFPLKNMFSGFDGNSDVYLPSKTISFGIKLDF
ncbi:MAG: SusC/RagA family TonB-linked outer membrane protein [Bacteroidales bacterium]